MGCVREGRGVVAGLEERGVRLIGWAGVLTLIGQPPCLPCCTDHSRRITAAAAFWDSFSSAKNSALNCVRCLHPWGTHCSLDAAAAPCVQVSGRGTVDAVSSIIALDGPTYCALFATTGRCQQGEGGGC